MNEPIETPALAIRHASLADIDAMAALLTQLGYPTEAADLPLRLQRLAAGRGVVLLAAQGPQILGLATAHLLSVVNRERDVCWLTAMVVDASARRAGVGRALVAAVEAHARAQGCEWLSVTTHERRSDAQDFYRGIGMAQTGRRFGKALD